MCGGGGGTCFCVAAVYCCWFVATSSPVCYSYCYPAFVAAAVSDVAAVVSPVLIHLLFLLLLLLRQEDLTSQLTKLSVQQLLILKVRARVCLNVVEYVCMCDVYLYVYV